MTKPTAAKNARKTSTNGDAVGINVQLPRQVHQALRIKAFSNDQTLTEAITEAVDEWTRKR